MVPTGRGKQLFTEVVAWFSSSASGPFDFGGICEATGLDPGYIRKGLLDWYRSQRPRPDPRTVAGAHKTAASLPLCVRTRGWIHRPLDVGGAATHRWNA